MKDTINKDYFEYYYVDKVLSNTASIEDLLECEKINDYDFVLERHKLDPIKKEYDKTKKWYYDALKFDLDYLHVLSHEDPTNIAFMMAIKKKEEDISDDDIFEEVVQRIKKNKRID